MATDDRCLYADVAGEDGCALRATADSPPPTTIQIRELVLENRRLREELAKLRRAIEQL